ncbi:hypothetical protein KI387_024702, partial [Taxus chinensis]
MKPEANTPQAGAMGQANEDQGLIRSGSYTPPNIRGQQKEAPDGLATRREGRRPPSLLRSETDVTAKGTNGAGLPS